MKKITNLLVMLIMTMYANTVNYAEKWQAELIEFIMQDTLSSEHITSNVTWLDAKTFHFTIMKTSGYKDHSRAGGWNRGDIVQTDVPFALSHDRDVEFFIDIADKDESGQTMTIQNTTNSFMIEQSNPEIDAYFFSTVASASVALGDFVNDQVVGTDITVSNVVATLKSAILPKRRYGASNLRMYVSSAVMDLLEQSDKFTRQINIQRLAPADMEGDVLETRVTYLDGVKLIEVYDEDRFYDAFDFTTGFAPIVATSRAINFLLCTISHTKTVVKISSIYTHLAGTHTDGDGDLYQNRSYWDTFNFPNAKTSAVDSLYVNLSIVLA